MPSPHGGNWDNTKTLGSLVPGLSTTLKTAQQEIAAAKALEQAAQQKLTTQIQTKLNELNNVINQAQRLFNDITNNLDSTGVHFMDILPNTGGYNGLITDLSIATNKPMPATTGYYAGAIIIVSGPDLTQTASFFSKMQKLFTLQ